MRLILPDFLTTSIVATTPIVLCLQLSLVVLNETFFDNESTTQGGRIKGLLGVLIFLANGDFGIAASPQINNLFRILRKTELCVMPRGAFWPVHPVMATITIYVTVVTSAPAAYVTPVTSQRHITPLSMPT